MPTITITITTLADAIRQARLISGQDQTQLSLRADVARQTLSSYENGRTEPPFSVLVRIAEATGQSLDWFASALNDKEPAPEGTGSYVVRPEGLEPPTFCIGVKSAWELAS